MGLGRVARVLGAMSLVVGAVAACAVGSVAGTVSASGFSCTSGGATYTVRSGDSWFAIAQRVKVSAAELLSANSAESSDRIDPGDTLCLPAGADQSGACAMSYTVVSGDGWGTIARKAATTLNAVLAVNGGDVGKVIHPGDKVCLPAGSTAPQAAAGSSGGTVSLAALPLQGPCWYFDTWRVSRGNGRRHMGVDLLAGQGQYVYAVADGRITDKAWDQPDRIAGNALELTVADGTFYFYAHLLDFAPGISVGERVQAGEIIGWVGETGNASSPNLHFEIHPGGGEAVNPYPYVKAAGGCNRGTPYTQPSGWVPD